MANPGQPTVRRGDSGDVVRRAQRGVRRTPNTGLVVDGIFGAATEKAIKLFQKGAGLAVDGIVGPATWHALPDGGPMPTLSEGSTGAVVRHLQTVLKDGSDVWGKGPGAVDGDEIRSRRFRSGVASGSTGSSEIRRGPCRCTR